MSIKKTLSRTIKSILKDKARRRWSFGRTKPKSPLSRVRSTLAKVRA